MAMTFTQNELRMVIAWAEWRTSRSLGLIGDDETTVPPELTALIAASPAHEAALRRLVDAYRAWYAFHVEIDAAGKSGLMSAAETDALMRLIEDRDAAKQDLIYITPV